MSKVIIIGAGGVGGVLTQKCAQLPEVLGWYQTLSLFEPVVKQRDIIGFDIMEFAPIKGFHAYDFSAAMLTYKMMGIIQRNRQC